MTNPSADKPTMQDGDVLTAPYPFVQEKIILPDFDFDGSVGQAETLTWRPGVLMEPDGAGDFDAIADGVGKIILTVVAVFKPGRFPTRAFYTRCWETPDGKTFGKQNLRVTTASNLRAIGRGYRHSYTLREKVTA